MDAHAHYHNTPSPRSCPTYNRWRFVFTFRSHFLTAVVCLPHVAYSPWRHLWRASTHV